MIYTHCKGCGMELTFANPEDRVDGLCSAFAHLYTGRSRVSCYHRWRLWFTATPGNSVWSFDSPQHAVAIDQWLERGMP